jgi:hypothetical protein
LDLIFSVESDVLCFQILFVVLYPSVVVVLGKLHERERRGCFIDGKSEGREKFEIVVNVGCTQMSVEHACTPTRAHVNKTF